MRVAMAQCAHPEDGDVLGMARGYVERAASAGAQLVVFPECLMTRFDGDVDAFAAAAQTPGGPFSRAMRALAQEAGLWVLFTMNERADQGLPYNTAVLCDERGQVRRRYRKVHLFDCQGKRESSRMQAGSELAEPVEAPFGRLGLAICYDLRFPEVALSGALAGAQVMLYPAAWVEGPGKVEQWRTLLSCRAIECGLFTVGVSRTGEGYVGHSCAFAPDGSCVAEAGAGEELLVADLDLSRIEAVRAQTPSLLHRRPDVYGSRR